ncbi:MAG: HEAT repeat domain-containing protein [Bryobacteraceae bacterium]|nr:HEAT repeat domain-containing protein [Bryobacteraceae bacterium]MDW8379003.1 HEAT repeat domain-containing protein [Bryobacterales bacterium]
MQVFGAQRIAPEKIRRALGVKEGDPIPPSKASLEERVEQLDGILRASIEAVCCEESRAILYVGVEERGGERFEYREPPNGEIRLPEGVVAEWARFLDALAEAARQGEVAEDISRGHAFSQNLQVRQSQLQFVEFAAQHFELLREVLHHSSDEQQRAIAAYILGYSDKKKDVVNDLQAAMRDPDVTVRNHAMRALTALAVFAQQHPESEIRVPVTWFVEMLHSIHFTDRNKATLALLTLTETREARILDHIRERALAPLLEMAQWRVLEHAFPAFLLLGRVAGLPEEEIHDLWKKGARGELVARLSKDSGKRKK